MMHVQREKVWRVLQAEFERVHGAEERRLSGVDVSGGCETYNAHEASKATSVSMWYEKGISQRYRRLMLKAS
jgi:hypothetical protein